MKKLSLFIAMAFVSHSILAQEFCEKLLKNGIAAYDSNNYIEAMRFFSQGMNENNKCNTAVFREWIMTCYDKMNTTFSDPEVLLRGTLINKEKVEFDGKSSESETGSSAKAAIIAKVWQEHNAVENNVYGIRIHVNFMVKNMLNQQGNCTVRFYFDNGNKLMDVDSNYSAPDGQIAVSKNFTPTYVNSKYSDFMIFMPYSELHRPTDTRQDLKFKVGIFDDANNQLITSDFFRFSIGIE
ncbi:MAG: hypothetical protein LBL18_01650 [Bacteroidales bacterium]|jgi:hypothetical protein|nr:hypothetical protein [Bacteroidales bacterium]